MQVESYEKPIIASQTSASSVIPLAAIAALSAAEAAAIASAAGFGLGLAMGSNSRGRSDVLPFGRRRILQEAEGVTLFYSAFL